MIDDTIAELEWGRQGRRQHNLGDHRNPVGSVTLISVFMQKAEIFRLNVGFLALYTSPSGHPNEPC